MEMYQHENINKDNIISGSYKLLQRPQSTLLVSRKNMVLTNELKIKQNQPRKENLNPYNASTNSIVNMSINGSELDLRKGQVVPFNSTYINAGVIM